MKKIATLGAATVLMFSATGEVRAAGNCVFNIYHGQSEHHKREINICKLDTDVISITETEIESKKVTKDIEIPITATTYIFEKTDVVTIRAFVASAEDTLYVATNDVDDDGQPHTALEKYVDHDLSELVRLDPGTVTCNINDGLNDIGVTKMSL